MGKSKTGTIGCENILPCNVSCFDCKIFDLNFACILLFGFWFLGFVVGAYLLK